MIRIHLSEHIFCVHSQFMKSAFDPAEKRPHIAATTLQQAPLILFNRETRVCVFESIRATVPGHFGNVCIPGSLVKDAAHLDVVNVSGTILIKHIIQHHVFRLAQQNPGIAQRLFKILAAQSAGATRVPAAHKLFDIQVRLLEMLHHFANDSVVIRGPASPFDHFADIFLA